LQYKGNSAQLTQKQKWAQIAKGKSHNKKQAWASQTQTVTNPNVNNLTQVRNTLICEECPTKEVIGTQNVTTQAQANALSGVTKITGGLGIFGNVTDWSPFNCLKEITDNFTIRNTLTLTTISGFGNLETIGGYFFIRFNANLKSISGFGRMTSIGNNFSIYQNNALETISGFGNLTSIGDILIAVNIDLTTISGFGSLRSVEGEFVIADNTELTNLQFSAAFNNLESIAGNISVYGNESGATNWTMPTGWSTAPELKWGTAVRSLSGANFSGPAQGDINALDTNS
jgi:hypothetical protein